MQIDIWHNIMWSKYKGAVFSALHRLAPDRLEIKFFQIAETENDRLGLSGVDLAYHKYPFTLMFKGSYERVPKLELIYRLCQQIVKSDAEVVVLAGYHRVEYWAQLAVAKLTGKAILVFCDSTKFDRPRSTIKEAAKRAFFRACDGFFCYGERSSEYLRGYGVQPTKIFVRCQAAALPPNYDPDLALENRLERIKCGLPPVALYVGRLSREKNLVSLIRSFRPVANARPDAELRIVGDGPDSVELKALVDQLDLVQQVTFLGSRSGPELYEEYAKAACLVLPSLSEPWGLVVNEALSFGCPVLVSDRCGCSCELVVEGQTGFTFPASDERALTERLRHMLSIEFNTEATARACVNHISSFTPEIAAEAIAAGLRAIREGACYLEIKPANRSHNCDEH